MARAKGAEPAADQGLIDPHSSRHFWTLVIGSIGVVYGDIGTSPLYAFREAVHAASGGGAVGRGAILGVLSLIFLGPDAHRDAEVRRCYCYARTTRAKAACSP